MNKSSDTQVDVLIVGAGPSGLMMACQLAMHSVSFLIIDKNTRPSTCSGALILQARTLEIFEQMGIAHDAIENGIIAENLNMVINNKTLISVSIKDIGHNLSQFPYLLMHEQSKTEQLLIDFLNKKGKVVSRDTEFKNFTQENDEIQSELLLANGSKQIIRSKYIIAADGVRSTVRNLLNIPFSGKKFSKPIFILDCKANTQLNTRDISIVFSKTSVAGFFPLQGSRWRIDGTIPSEMEPMDIISRENIIQNFHNWTNMKIEFEDNEWFSITHSYQQYAHSIQNQNCFIIGDAAHINTPIGAQGMNAGIQDAFNLAWKLSFVINNKAKPDLLNTYTSERLGITKGFARYADLVFKIVTNTNLTFKFLRFYIIKFFLIFFLPVVKNKKFIRQSFFISISKIGINYRRSNLSYLTKNAVYKGKPQSGDRLPYVEFQYKGKLTNDFKILNSLSFSLLIFAKGCSSEMKLLAERYHLAIKIISFSSNTEKLYEKLGIMNNGYMLIRPDLHIALRSDSMQTDHLKNYLAKIYI